jgi:hypothetical protein
MYAMAITRASLGLDDHRNNAIKLDNMCCIVT